MLNPSSSSSKVKGLHLVLCQKSSSSVLLFIICTQGKINHNKNSGLHLVYTALLKQLDQVLIFNRLSKTNQRTKHDTNGSLSFQLHKEDLMWTSCNFFKFCNTTQVQFQVFPVEALMQILYCDSTLKVMSTEEEPVETNCVFTVQRTVFIHIVLMLIIGRGHTCL